MSMADPTQHLAKVDPVMRRLIREIGPYNLQTNSRRPPFEILVRAIANQQLNGTAAETILRRLAALFPGKKSHEARQIGFDLLFLYSEPAKTFKSFPK